MYADHTFYNISLSPSECVYAVLDTLVCTHISVCDFGQTHAICLIAAYQI